MKSMKELVEIQLDEHTTSAATTPVSFRCSDEIILKMDLLTKYLNFSTRSKLLSELVPVALEDAVHHLPSHVAEAFEEEYQRILMYDLFEERADQGD